MDNNVYAKICERKETSGELFHKDLQLSFSSLKSIGKCISIISAMLVNLIHHSLEK